LARRGYRVLLLDRATFPSDMPMSTHFIHQRGIACLARWGLREQIVATKSRPVTRVDIEIGPFALSGAAPPVDGETSAFAPRRILLDEILVRAATSSNAELREACRVTQLLYEDRRVAGVKGVTRTGAAFSEQATIVVGADGPSSRVAAGTQAVEYGSKPALAGTAWIYWKDISQEHLEFHYRDYEGIFAFPSSNGRTLIGANWSIDRFRAARRSIENSYFELLGQAAPELAARVAEARKAEEKIRFGFTRNFFRKACGPGWVLLGDAHYKKDPCTAQGISDAFCDAEALAETIDQGLSGKRDLLQGLEDYEAARIRLAMPFYDLTCQMATLAPPAPDMAEIYSALKNNQDDTNAFIGLITGAVSPSQFFAAENIERILKLGRSRDNENA